MSDYVEMTPEARWRHLRENGVKVATKLESNDLIAEKPKWFDEERFLKAKETVQKYLVGVMFSSFTGLLLILQLPDGLEPLLSTGNSKDIPSLHKRYLNTVIHVNSWYDDDVFNPDTKGYKSIRQVRCMHKRVQSLMNNKMQVAGKDGKPRVWMNQYDVAMTQFAFIGLAMLYPQKSALIAASKEDLELINYYWRVLGYLMGIDDEFNACQFDKYEDIVAFHKLIFEHEYLDSFKSSRCQMGLEMTQSICVAMHYFMPLVTFNNLAHWWKEHFNFNGYEPQPMSVHEKLLDYWTKVSFNHLLKSKRFLSFANKLHKKRFDSKLKNRDKVYEKLKEQYKDDTKHTYYSERANYFAKDDKNSGNDVTIFTDEIDSNNNELANGNNLIKTAGGCPFGFSSAPPPEIQQSSTKETSVAA